jgi:hypothetical protein
MAMPASNKCDLVILDYCQKLTFKAAIKLLFTAYLYSLSLKKVAQRVRLYIILGSLLTLRKCD